MSDEEVSYEEDSDSFDKDHSEEEEDGVSEESSAEGDKLSEGGSDEECDEESYEGEGSEGYISDPPSSDEASEEGSEASEDGSDDDEIDVDDLLGLDEMLSIFYITDIHFKDDCFAEGEEFIEKVLDMIDVVQPTRIIIGGDLLHTKNMSKQSPFDQTRRLLEGCADRALTDVIMGNHDLINKSQFLSDKHFFNPYKRWENITIIDRPMVIPFGKKNLVLCPYVSPGRLIEALDTLATPNLNLDCEGSLNDESSSDGDSEQDDCEADLEDFEPFDWKEADLIFTHADFQGYEGNTEPKADKWDDSYPPVINGHIHKPCKIGTNIWCPGSSRQVDFNEDPDKRVWVITFPEGERPDCEAGDSKEPFQYDAIDLGLTARKEIEMECSELKHFDFDLCEKYVIKIRIRGTAEQFKLFKASQLHAKMLRHKIKLDYIPNIDDVALLASLDFGSSKDDVTFEGILKVLVEKKNPRVQRAYKALYVSDETDDD